MPFDQFTIEQLAGDMLPNATIEQKIATGFHRNTMLNEEGGIDPQEFRFYAMVDRVSTTATTWLGMTLGCAQCHTHKYDPIPHADYYRFMALLNNSDEPTIDVPQPDVTARRQRVDAEPQIMPPWRPGCPSDFQGRRIGAWHNRAGADWRRSRRRREPRSSNWPMARREFRAPTQSGTPIRWSSTAI